MTTIRFSTPGALRAALQALQNQWRASAFPRFFAWWGAQLAACLPPQVRAWFSRREQPQWLRWQNQQLWTLGDAGWEPLNPSAVPGSSGCVLLLGHGQALVRTLSFPAAAADDLASAVAFEMDRYTPFKAAQLYFAIKRLPGKPRQPVAVTLAAVRREQLDALLHQLELQGLRPQAVDVAVSEPGRGLGVNLLPRHRYPPGDHRQRRMSHVLGALVLCLGLGCLQLWLYNRDAALESMQQEVARLRTAASELEGWRQQLRNGQGAADYLAGRRQAIPAVSLVLSELTQCLPLDTWLSQLSLDTDGQLSLAGQSPHAGSLIGDLKACPSITAAQFQGVIQPDETTGNERFYLLARLNTKERTDAPAIPAP